jgi:hypothetical protein
MGLSRCEVQTLAAAATERKGGTPWANRIACAAMKAPALIVRDMLNDFLRAFEPSARERLLRSTNKARPQPIE